MDKGNKILKVTEGLATILMKFKQNEFKGTKGGDLSLKFFEYINVIDKLKNPTYTELAEALDLSKPAVTAIINKLISQDIVYKSRSVKDRRVYFIHLTKEGEKISYAYQQGYLNFVDHVMDSLSEDEVDSFIELSEKIISGGK
ncbi:MarR family transcriptional regulator [Orenia metallireducens]|uniref:Transcriptional regulator, MarR family n=1 Tax=Orenia metallireducens TaxID=1413210 RepID=A0A285G1N8_9FIRM|nr:MarR family transcriptional regulator [Orenia metallireducens]PRX31786.1 MarR family transcriptional regulator [Orenia metallireducens]SNY17263.1 transcriptional regulator, MarR family [Orenia metallireducens]